MARAVAAAGLAGMAPCTPMDGLHTVTDITLRIRVAPALLALAAFALLPNMVFWLIGCLLFTQRALFNLDYLLLGMVCLAITRLRALVAVALVALLSLDLVFALAPAYHFSLESAWTAFSDLLGLDTGYVILMVALLLAVPSAVAAAMLGIVRRLHSPLAAATLGCFLLAVAGASVLSHRSFEGPGSRLVVPNVATSTLNSLHVAAMTAGAPSHSLAVASGAPAATSGLAQEITAGRSGADNVILIVVESLGQFVADELNALQFSALTPLKSEARWAVQRGQVEFRGSTVAGELRELCQVDYSTVRPDVERLPVEACLVAVAARAGMTTTAYHGFLPSFFSRNRWYPALGFDTVRFAPDMASQDPGLPRCGTAFNGICDEAVWNLILDQVRQDPDQKHFVYWLTLTAHLPVPEHHTPGDRPLCDRAQELRDHDDVCDLVLWHHHLFSRIAEDLMAGELENTLIVLVGDHSPPFIDRRRRDLFSTTHVPYVTIRD